MVSGLPTDGKADQRRNTFDAGSTLARHYLFRGTSLMVGKDQTTAKPITNRPTTKYWAHHAVPPSQTPQAPVPIATVEAHHLTSRRTPRCSSHSRR